MTWDFYGDGEDFILKEDKKETPKEIIWNDFNILDIINIQK